MIQSATARPVSLKSTTPDFWHSIGIFPEALTKGKSDTELALSVKKKLRGLGKPQLRAVCSHFNISSEPRDDTDRLADTLFSGSDLQTLVCLKEFEKRKADFIGRVFQNAIPGRTRNSLLGTELTQLKTFPELMVLFNKSEKLLKDVFYSHLWESKRTHTDFQCTKPLTTGFLRRLKTKESEFAQALSKAWKKGVRVFGVHKLPNGLTVVAFDREYAPTVQRDYHDNYSLNYRCGDIIFGVSKDRDFIHVKTGSSELTDVIKSLIEDVFKVELTPEQNLVFSDYDAKTLQGLLLGDYSEKTEVEITAASFRRTSLGTRSAVSVASAENSLSIRDDLKALREADVVALDSLDDLDHIHVTADDRTTRIDVQTERSGAIRFSLDDKNCTADHTDFVKSAFRDTFGIPLNRLIDPERMALGHVGILSYLLNIKTECEVQDFQRVQYEQLKTDGLVETTTKSGLACNRGICSKFGEIVSDSNSRRCGNCDRSLQTQSYIEVVRNDQQIHNFVRAVLRDAGWHVGKERTFEGRPYLPVNPASESRDPICAFFRDTLPNTLREQMERSSHALLTLPSRSGTNDVGHNGMFGQLSLAYVIACQQDAGLKKQCQKRCTELLKNLLKTSHLRILNAANRSREILRKGTTGMSGNEYETEVFNILRALLPYSYKLGRTGKPEPDGFVCMPTFDDGDGNRELADGKSWNWTYDAKHSDDPDGYDLGRDEHRKMTEYISAIRRKRGFMGSSEKPHAHVIISNNLSERKMRSATSYVFGADGIPKKAHGQFKLVFMKEEFLTAVYDAISDKREEFQLRQALFGEHMKLAMIEESSKGYLALDHDRGMALVDELLKMKACDKVMTKHEVLTGIDAKH